MLNVIWHIGRATYHFRLRELIPLKRASVKQTAATEPPGVKCPNGNWIERYFLNMSQKSDIINKLINKWHSCALIISDATKLKTPYFLRVACQQNFICMLNTSLL